MYFMVVVVVVVVEVVVVVVAVIVVVVGVVVVLVAATVLVVAVVVYSISIYISSTFHNPYARLSCEDNREPAHLRRVQILAHYKHHTHIRFGHK